MVRKIIEAPLTMQEILLCLLFALLNAAMVECACPGGWIAYNDNYGKWCFLISAEKRSWYSAAAECQSWNAHLAKIDSMDELMFLSKEIDNAPHLTSSHFWIGGKDSALWNKFEWTSTGTFVDQGFTYWWPGEPNNLGNTERCLEIRHGSSYRDTWNDEDCPRQYHFICKKSSIDTSNMGAPGRPSNLNPQQTINNQNTDSHNTYNPNTYNQNMYNQNTHNQNADSHNTDSHNTHNQLQNNNFQNINGTINNNFQNIIGIINNGNVSNGNVAFGKK